MAITSEEYEDIFYKDDLSQKISPWTDKEIEKMQGYWTSRGEGIDVLATRKVQKEVQDILDAKINKER